MKNLKNLNILLVEDEKLTREALRHCIESIGHRAFLAENGEEAIRLITDHKIDFVISDIMMPGISGLALVSVLRNVHCYVKPIILISTLDNVEMQNTSISLGADDFISKPFTIADIAYKINKYAKE